MKLWIDDVRPVPTYWSYIWCRSVNEAKRVIELYEGFAHANKENGYPDAYEKLEYIDIDHDAGDYAKDGGDYIKLLDWLEETGRNYPIRIHSANVVGVQNMRRIIERNGWKEIR